MRQVIFQTSPFNKHYIGISHNQGFMFGGLSFSSYSVEIGQIDLDKGLERSGAGAGIHDSQKVVGFGISPPTHRLLKKFWFKISMELN